MPDQPAIETRDLTKTYVEGLLRRKRQQALKGVSLRVERGEIFGLLGGNGAGNCRTASFDVPIAPAMAVATAWLAARNGA